MLFKKDMDPSCSYCANGTVVNETDIMCRKRGIVAIGGSCRSFKYDPLKRTPSDHLAVREKYTPADFSLDFDDDEGGRLK